MSATLTRKGPPRGQGKHGRPTFNQASRIIARFGGEARLARALNLNRVTLYRWNYAAPYGCDGLVPSKARLAIEQLARTEGILLTAHDWAAERIAYALAEEVPA